MMIVVVMVVITVSGPIAHLLLARKFWSASLYVAVGAVAEGVRVAAGSCAMAAHASKRTRALLLPHSVGAASIVLTLLGGTFLFGEKAVAPAMVLSAFIFMATMHVTMVRHAGTKISLLGGRWVISWRHFLRHFGCSSHICRSMAGWAMRRFLPPAPPSSWQHFS